MNFFNELEKHLSVKQHVLIQDVDGGYCIFSSLKDNYGNWRKSPWEATEINAMLYIGYEDGYSPETLNEKAKKYNWRIIKAFDIPTGKFKVGDKVIVSEDAKELCEALNFEWKENFVLEEEKNNFIGQVCKIREIIGSNYYLSNLDNLFSFGFPHEALSYPIETEKENTAAQEAIELLTQQSEYRPMTMELAFELLEKNGYVISKK